MAERIPGAGRYAHLEREQRWVLNGLPADARLRCEIHDRYLRGTRLRLRRVTTGGEVVHKLGQKVRLIDSDPERVHLTNLYLSAHEYDVLAAAPAAAITKWRYSSRWGRELTVDEFHGRWHGLVLAEVELGPSEDMLGLPPFAVRDVTHDDRFSGGALANCAAGTLRALLAEAAQLATPST